MIVAGIGCRRGCTAGDIVAVIRLAEAHCNHTVDTLAAPAFKLNEAGLHAAAILIGLPLLFIDEAEMVQAQAACVTYSTVARAATGLASVAEAAALAATGGRLLQARVATGAATCAIAGP